MKKIINKIIDVVADFIDKPENKYFLMFTTINIALALSL